MYFNHKSLQYTIKIILKSCFICIFIFLTNCTSQKQSAPLTTVFETSRGTQTPAFGVSDSGQTKLWAWLELAPAAGSSLIAWMNPAAGLEEFIGTWDVEVKINNRMVSKRQFEVIC